MIKNEKGITLVELLAALALTSIVIMLVSQFFFVHLDSMNHQQVRADLQREASNVFQKFQQLGYNAQNIVFEEDGSLPIKFCNSSGSTMLNLSETELVQGTTIIARSIESLTVKQSGALLEVTVELERYNRKFPVNYTETTTIRMRNYEEGSVCKR